MTKRRDRWILLAAAFLLPVLLYAVVLAATRTVPFGDESLLMYDAFVQDAAFLTWWRGVLTGVNNLLYSLGNGLGNGMMVTIGWCVASPLNLILPLFSETDVPLVFSLLILLRIGLSGLTFFLFLRESFRCGRAGLLFSTAYALMGMVTAYWMLARMMDAIVLLPLVALGVRRIVYRQKPFLYLFALAVALISNFYSGYMLCLFSLVYLICLWIGRGREIPYRKGERGRILRQFTGASLLAGGIDAVLLLPVALGLGGQELYTDLLAFTRLYTVPGLLSKLYTGAMSATQIAPGGLPNLYIGIPLLVLLPMYFFNSAIPLRRRLVSLGLVALLWASFRIRVLYYAWHAFDSPTWYEGRFSFLFSFVLIEIAAQGYLRLDAMARKTRALVSVCTAVCFLVLTWYLFRRLYVDYLAYKTIIMDAAVCTATCALIAWDWRGKWRGISRFAIFGMLCVCLMLNSYYPIVRLREVDSHTASDFETGTAQTADLTGRILQSDSSVYRMVKNYKFTSNDPLLFGYAGLTYFNSDCNKEYLAFALPVGLSQHALGADYGGGTRPVIEMLFGIKYVLQKDETILQAPPESYRPLWTDDGVTAYENTMALPLAYCVPEAECEFTDDNLFVNQNLLVSDLAGEALYPYKGGAEIVRTYDGTWETYTFQAEAGRRFYMYSRGGDYQFNNGAVVTDGRYRGTIALPVAEETETYTLRMTGPLGIHLAYLHEPTFRQAYDILSAHAAEVASDTDSHLVIHAAVTDGHTQLLVTIPYDAGWRATVDGEPAETTARYGALLAVNLAPGEHTVELRFVPKGLWAGAAISGASLGIAILWVVLGRRRHQK